MDRKKGFKVNSKSKFIIMMNFDNLPSDIKNLIFEQNRKSNNEINRDKKLNLFWEEWGEDYEDDIEEFFYDELISSPNWEELKIKEKINIYKRHLRSVARHESIMCDGSALDEDY